jgi:hypothetical protein
MVRKRIKLSVIASSWLRPVMRNPMDDLQQMFASRLMDTMFKAQGKR